MRDGSTMEVCINRCSEFVRDINDYTLIATDKGTVMMRCPCGTKYVVLAVSHTGHPWGVGEVKRVVQLDLSQYKPFYGEILLTQSPK